MRILLVSSAWLQTLHDILSHAIVYVLQMSSPEGYYDDTI